MKPEYQHKILVVVDDKKIGDTLKNIFLAKKNDCVLVNKGESALEEIKKAEQPFSVIIANQGLGGMTGTQVLEQTREIAPDTIRVLMTSHSQIDTIIQAVNKGAIQNFIVKPWRDEDLEKAIKSSIKLYNKFLENKNILKLAKKQSTTLYELNKKLMEATKNHNKTIHTLDINIETLKKEIQTVPAQTSDSPESTPDQIIDKIIDEIKTHVKTDTGLDAQKIQTLFNSTIKGLYNKFNEIAYQNGFEMPAIKGEIK